MNKAFKSFYLFLFIFLLNICSTTFPQNIQPSEESYFYPQRMPFGQFKSFIGLSMANLPEDVIESDDIFYAPLFAYYIKYGLPANILLEASANSNLVTYHIALGLKWNYEIDKFSVAPGYDVAYWFGGLKHFGFNSKVRGWIHYPNITFGYEFRKFTITIKGELILVTFLKELQEDLVVARDRNFYSGFAVTTVIEQPLWKDNFILIGIKMNYTKFYYPQWAAFSRFNRFFFIPEFLFGFVL